MATVLVQPSPAAVPMLVQQHVQGATIAEHHIDLAQIPTESVTVYRSCAAVIKKFLVPLTESQNPSRSRNVWIHIVNFPPALIQDSLHIRGFGNKDICIEKTSGTTIKHLSSSDPTADQAMQRQESVITILSNEKRKLTQLCERLLQKQLFLKNTIINFAQYGGLPKQQNQLYAEELKEQNSDDDDPLAPSDSDDDDDDEKINSNSLFNQLLTKTAFDSYPMFTQRYEQELQSLSNQWLEAKEREKIAEEELQRALQRKSELTQPTKRERDVFRFSVLVHIPSVIIDSVTLDFELFYLVSSCKWEAFYDLKVSSLEEAAKEKKREEDRYRAPNAQRPNPSSSLKKPANSGQVQFKALPKLSKYPAKSNSSLTYYANISQQTGEHWHQVRLYLCTIDPQFVMKTPSSISSLPVHFVSFSARQKGWSILNWFTSIISQDSKYADQVIGAVAQEQSAHEDGKSGAGMYHFKIGQLHTIPSDEQQHKICIEPQVDLFSRFQHVAIPRNANEDLFLKMTALNPLTRQPFLKGKVNVFHEGNYSCASKLEKDVNPGEKFAIFLGQENLNFKIDYLVERAEKNLTYNKRTIKVRRIITITRKNESIFSKNNVIMLQDLVPKTTDAEIQVDLLEPVEMKPLYTFVTAPNTSQVCEAQGKIDPFVKTNLGLSNVIMEPKATALQKFKVRKIHLSPDHIVSFKFCMGESKKICLKLVYSVSFHPRVNIDTLSL